MNGENDIILSFINLFGKADITIIKSRRLMWAGHVARMGDRKRVHKRILGKAEREHSCGRLKITWEDNIIRDLKEVDYDVDW